jgi:sec-independent protein translocase protein TatC
LFSFANDLYTFVAGPLLRHLPKGTSMIATEVASPFLTPFKLTLVVSIFICIPYLLYQAWAFIAPGLYKNERKLVFPLLLSSTVLFYLGMVFAYYVVFPLVFGFLTATAPEGVAVSPDISRYLDFVLKMFFAFGVAFEVPIATIVVIWSGLTTAQSLAAKRPYVIVAAFVIGMLLTPPDVISQTLLALPMWALFELGLFFSRLYTREATTETEGAVTAQTASPTDQQANARAENYNDEFAGTKLQENEMDAELDRIAAEERNFKYDDTQEPHAEYEPFEPESPDEPSAPKGKPD